MSIERTATTTFASTTFAALITLTTFTASTTFATSDTFFTTCLHPLLPTSFNTPSASLQLRATEAEIRRGLLIFRMDLPPSHDLLLLEKHLGEIEAIWDIAIQWDNYWDEWRLGAFATLKTEFMEDVSNEIIIY